MEAAKAQNRAVEPQEKKVSLGRMFNQIRKFLSSLF
jgi:hypothetical protein